MRRAIVCAFVLVALATACTSSTSSRSSASTMKWDSANVRSYTWTIEESGMAGSVSYTVKVLDGKPDASPEWRPFGTTHPTTRPLTVEDLFSEIDNARETADVTYDDSLGYPRQINFNAHTPNVSDDEWSYTVTSFEVND